MTKATLHDGSAIELEVHGEGPVLLLPVNPRPIEGPQADSMRQWGADPALGRSLIEGLRDAFQVVAFDYEGHVLASPKPETLTPDNIARDLLAVADSVGADRFAYYGYSWLALSGLQLAIRTDRLSALVMGGFPPLGGPYAAMLRVTMATYEMSVSPQEPAKEPAKESAEESAEKSQASAQSDAETSWTSDEIDWSSVEMKMTEPQTKQFVTLYEALREFDDQAVQARIDCPRLCFAGSADDIEYGERWGDVRVNIASTIISRRAEIEAFGWDVKVLDGLDHMSAMQAANVLPTMRPWLLSKVGAQLSE
ncbi:alpha/beta hydrolase [Streptosporangium sp. NPDC051023]|uniref:alpha/beta fold hydrolase n=1 Tax=Streptosporangium sp. NPDC051023 TaxID=3155410 RepID=UPI00344E5D04